MTERNPIPACLSHLEQMLPKRVSSTALHYLLNDLRNYAKTLEDGDSDGVMIIAEDAAEAMLRAVESLEATCEPEEAEPSAAAGMTLAERTLLLSVAGWLSSVLMGHVLVAPPEPPHSGLRALDGAAILRTQAEAVRKESQS